MDEGHNFIRLKAAILPLSHASDWETARKEWALSTVYEADEPDTCPCGHYPIIEICEIANRVTSKRAELGNVCVKRFLGFRCDLILDGIKRVRSDLDKSLNADAIVYFKEKSVLSNWEYRFLQDTRSKRSLSEAQAAIRRRINLKVLSAIERRGFKGPD